MITPYLLFYCHLSSATENILSSTKKLVKSGKCCILHSQNSITRTAFISINGIKKIVLNYGYVNGSETLGNGWVYDGSDVFNKILTWEGVSAQQTVDLPVTAEIGVSSVFFTVE